MYESGKKCTHRYVHTPTYPPTYLHIHTYMTWHTVHTYNTLSPYWMIAQLLVEVMNRSFVQIELLPHIHPPYKSKLQRICNTYVHTYMDPRIYLPLHAYIHKFKVLVFIHTFIHTNLPSVRASWTSASSARNRLRFSGIMYVSSPQRKNLYVHIVTCT